MESLQKMERPGMPDRARGAAQRHRRVAAWSALAALALFHPVVEAAEPLPAPGDPLSLERAVAIALENNPMVLERAADIDAARFAGRQARASRLPALTFRQVVVRTTAPADVFGLTMMQERFSMAEFADPASNPNAPEAFDDFASEFALGVPLYTGGKLSAGIRQADQMRRAAEAATGFSRYTVALYAAETYEGALLASAYAELAVRARETTARHAASARDFYDAGMIVESDLLQAQVHLAKMDEQVITAANAAQTARAGLNRVLGIDGGSVFTLEDTGQPADTSLPALAEAIERGLRERQDLAAQRAQAEAARQETRAAFGGFLPEVGASASWVAHDDKLFGGHGQSTTLAMQLRWNIWDWGQTHAGVQRSRASHRAAQERTRAAEQKAEFEIRSARHSVEEALARMEAARRGVASAERALAILEDRFAQGVARMTELLDAETAAHDARVRELNVRFDLSRAVRALLYAMGQNPVPEVQS